MKFVIFSTPQLIQSFISYRKKNRNRQLENAFYVNLCQIRTNTTNSLGKKTDKNTNFCTFCKQSKLMSWLTKLKQNKKLLVKTCIDLKKTSYLVFKILFRKMAKSIDIVSKKHKNTIKKKNRKYIYVYL